MHERSGNTEEYTMFSRPDIEMTMKALKLTAKRRNRATRDDLVYASDIENINALVDFMEGRIPK